MIINYLKKVINIVFIYFDFSSLEETKTISNNFFLMKKSEAKGSLAYCKEGIIYDIILIIKGYCYIH